MRLILLILVFQTFCSTNASAPMSLSSFERAVFTPSTSRYKRDTGDDTLRIHLQIYGKKYELRLRPSFAVFDENLRIRNGLNEDVGGVEQILEDHFDVQAVGYPYSRGTLTRIENGYIGSITLTGLQEDLIYFEPAALHFAQSSFSDVIAYRADDVKMARVHKFLSPIAFPGPAEMRPEKQSEGESVKRTKREASLENEKKNRCPLKVVADYKFYWKVGRNSTALVTRYIVNMIARVNDIYTVVNWDEGKESEISGRGKFFNMGFSIKEIKILDKPDDSNLLFYNGGGIQTESGQKFWIPDLLLRYFALGEGSGDFCLVHLLTAQSFKNSSVVGLAYLANPSNPSDLPNNGGICADVSYLNDNRIWYNTVFTSTIGNDEKNDYPLVTREAELIVAHEFGHAWGSAHDTPDLNSNVSAFSNECQPSYKEGGYYIMNSFAQTGFDVNNDKFSPCSKRSIRNVLTRRWANCFVEEKKSLCGNGIIEEGEECDEGILLPAATQALSCCTKSCKLRDQAVCSPFNHPCCTATCKFHSRDHVCLLGNQFQCKATAHCSGVSGDCPPAPPIEDGIECLDEGECQAGVCVPFCEKKKIGKKACICEDVEQSCHRCCRDPKNASALCEPHPGATDLKDGTWCIKGVCKNSKCTTEVTDQVVNLLTVLSDGNRFWNFVVSNMVGIIIVLFCCLWFPAGFIVRKWDEKKKASRQTSKLSKEPRKVIQISNVDMNRARLEQSEMVHNITGGISISGMWVSCYNTLQNCNEACHFSCYEADICNDSVGPMIACAPGLKT
ncbi:hypothetical protein WR25_08745 isoform C [Diploscapter pachys]|uniref:Peptidase M12B domain-containing protein n=2 Tax=Diploscapter pachys TaxID=2018661 RepID=A0A2A2KJK3_9BILA|nr:hypothetical protein WR25_08745 isoform C [Diploscapter pachys]